MSKQLILMRGLPGSGKSHLAGQLLKSFLDDGISAIIVSADDFHYGHSDQYDYKVKAAPFAHKKCQGDAAWHMNTGTQVIIVDNTNITISDMLPYFELASIYDYAIMLLESQASWAWDVNECTTRNEHQVPRETIQSMHDRFQPLQFSVSSHHECQAARHLPTD